MYKISALIPAYNEKDSIAETVESLMGIEEINELIIVDDGSTDGTADALTGMECIKLMRHRKNKGKGAAVKTGLKQVKSDFVLLLDADLKASASEVKKMAVYMGNDKLVIGVLPKTKKKNGFGITRTIALKGFEILENKHIESLLSGQRILPAEFIRNIDLPGDYSLEFKITLEAVRAGLEIVEVPVEMYHREYGRTMEGFLHRGRQCREILQLITKEVVNAKIHNHFFF